MDRRVARTRQSLQDALLTLMRDVPFEQIEIQMITDCANTARVTFYRHYATKEELLIDTIERIYQDLQSQFTVTSIERVVDFSQAPLGEALFRFLDKDRALHKKIFTGSASALIQQRIRYYIVHQLMRTFSSAPHYADLPVILIANHVASVTIGNIMWWLSEDLPYAPEYMARLTHWTAFTGALTLAGRGADLTLPPPEALRPPR